MSHVDNVMLTFEESECAPFIARINDWLLANAYRQTFGPSLASVHSAYGGSKVLEADLYVAAFNYFPEAAFFEFLRTLPWAHRDLVQVMIKRQYDEDGWSILNIDHGAASGAGSL